MKQNWKNLVQWFSTVGQSLVVLESLSRFRSPFGDFSIFKFTMRKSTFLIALLLLNSFSEIQTNNTQFNYIQTRFKSVYCNSIKEIISLKFCFVRAYSRTLATLNLGFFFPKTLDKPIMVICSIFQLILCNNLIINSSKQFSSTSMERSTDK
jgi:hypothetical protein